jgi:hypothetical protein
MARNARGGLLVKGIGAASERLYPSEVEGRAWGQGLGGWGDVRLLRQARRWLKRTGLWWEGMPPDPATKRKEDAHG